MVSFHHQEALNYKFKHKRANKSLSSVDRVSGDRLYAQSEYRLQSNIDRGYATHIGPNIFLTIEVDIESTNSAYTAMI